MGFELHHGREHRDMGSGLGFKADVIPLRGDYIKLAHIAPSESFRSSGLEGLN
jgi:hypothetical protein